MHCLLVVVFTTCTIIGADSEPTNATTHSRLPNVLIIGDSISIGYTPYVEAVLEGKAVVVHNEGNAAHSGNGLVKLDAWLGDTEWDVIHFNHGLHDLKYVDDSGKNVESKELGHIQVPLDQYEKNLDAIVTRLKQTRAKLIFATTTPFPDKPSGPLREVADCERYNAVALAVMKRHKIPVNDLYAFALPRLAELQRPNNVHFTDEGSEVLGGEVARRIESALATASRQTRPKHESIRGPGK
ncbi:MAG: SGNH/GDSL hydrolase family protein [Candidatus Hydrogenedentes bacterium]|nr:SGNH/GDSL hydrolase family protein [Candidatus Hydrogenedentota bacterium]